jgi:hypothetical protein
MLDYLLSPASVALQYRCVQLISLLYGVSLIIIYTEKLAERRMYASNGLMSWQVFSFDRATSGALFRNAPLSQSLFGPAGTAAGHLLGIAGVLLMWSQQPRTYSFTAGLFAIVLSGVLVQLRSAYAGDGAQQMNLVLGAGLLLGFNPWVRPLTGVICLSFIAAQSMLSYLASGLAKLVSPVWMKGDALLKIMATTAYGSELGYQLASINPRVTRILCVATVLAEAAFPLLLFAPKWVMLAFFLWGASFHLANAVLMGLNTFVWSYLATYPAIYFTWTCLHRSAR